MSEDETILTSGRYLWRDDLASSISAADYPFGYIRRRNVGTDEHRRGGLTGNS